jgi:hypothetical protein
LDAKALENDPEGMAFLKNVIGDSVPRAASSNAPSRPAMLLPTITGRRRRFLNAITRTGLRLLAFAIVVAAIARSGRPVLPRAS